MTFKSYSREKIRGKVSVLLPFLAVLLPGIAFVFWWGSLSNHVYLAGDIPHFELAIAIGLAGALLISLGAIIFYRKRLRTPRALLALFAKSTIMLSIFFLPLPDALVRYLPGERVSYQTEFDYTFPGPSRGKSGRCEMGLKIKDKSLKRWIVVCSSQAWLDAHFQRGMDRINVVEKVNRYGVQLESYQLDWSPIGMRSRTGISYPNDVY